MGYLEIAGLGTDPTFRLRTVACVNEQSLVYKDDGRGYMSRCAQACLRGDPPVLDAFVRTCSAAPGFADQGNDGIGDDELLAAVQTNFPTVGQLFFPDLVPPEPEP
jgi:hypothetical protein